ncbi:hypothetical protein [Methylobacter sp. sgz302048]|uniref:hypothetical protein n=1 Tax=Methylobacter sp. sgz302048 TaxID=3455945 RepID=UPI003FA1648E
MGGRNAGFGSLAYGWLPCQNQGEIHGRVRIAYLSGLAVCRKALKQVRDAYPYISILPN